MTANTPDHLGHPIIDRLATANPVDLKSMPSPAGPQGRKLLENIMTQPQSPNRSDVDPLHPSQDRIQAWGNNTKLVDIEAVRSNSQAQPGGGRRTRNRLVLVAAAAVLVVGLLGLFVLGPNNTPGAVAAVQQAAQDTSEITSGRIDVVFALEAKGDSQTDEQVAGQIEAVFDDNDLAFTISLDQSQSTVSQLDLPAREVRVIDNTVYVNDGGEWFSIEGGSFVAQMVGDFIHPREVLGKVQELFEITEVGSTTIEGIATTHYQSQVSLGDQSLAESGWLPLAGLDAKVEGDLTIDVYVDGDQLVRQLDLSGLAVNAPQPESVEIQVSVGFNELGVAHPIDVPSGVSELNPFGPGGN